MASIQDYIKLHVLVFLWGFTAILGKLISIPAVEMVFYRTILAAAGMGVLLMVSGKSFSTSRRDVMILMLTGSIVAVHWISFFASGRVSNPSTSLVGFATCSLWTALLEPLVKGRPVRGLEVGLGVLVIGGLAIIFSFNFQYPVGLLLGIASGITIAIFAVINSELVKDNDAYVITFYEMCGAAIAIALFFPVYLNTWSATGELELAPTVMDWVWLSVLAFLCTVYAYAASIQLMKRLSVFTIQLTLNLEPVYGIVLALLVFGESEVMSAGFYAGAVIILSAVFAYPALKWFHRSPSGS